MSVISFGVPSDLSIQGNLTVNTLNGLLKGVNGLVAVATAGSDYATPLQLTTTGVQLGATIAAFSGLIVTNLALTGSNLYVTLTGLSGQSNVNYATVVNLGLTGQALYNLATALSGAMNVQIASTGQQAWTAADNNGRNLSGSLAATGSQAWNAANSNAINLSGSLTQSGVQLGASITALSGYAAPAGAGYVYTTGTQTIVGAKTFLGMTVFTNITVTGTQTIVNTQEFDVAANFITLNATGGARDAGLFISTGFTGGNATGAVFGFDVPSNRWVFGIQGQQDDMSRLLAVASTGDVQSASGVLNAALIQSGVQLQGQIAGLSGIAVQTGNLRGYATAVTTGLDFLVQPDDYDAIRGLLG